MLRRDFARLFAAALSAHPPAARWRPWLRRVRGGAGGSWSRATIAGRSRRTGGGMGDGFSRTGACTTGRGAIGVGDSTTTVTGAE